MMQSGTVAAGEAKIFYHLMGEGPAICLVPSTGRSVHDFFELGEILVEAGFQVILPEPRGIGGSEGPLTGIDFHDFAADIVAAARTQSDRFIIAGHAYGCWIARTIAADYPEAVRGLVFIAAGAGKFPAELTGAVDILTSGNASREECLAALRLAFFAENSDPEPWLDGWHTDLKKAQRAAGAATDRETWWRSGSAPILDLVALQDPFRPPSTYNDYILTFGDRVTQKTINHASHALPDEKPAEVARHIAAWAKTLN